ncbi:MAG: hypothetical protein QMD43_04185 [Thermodesulfovibrio sp.]|uniref:hypothetical protein n=1 Tax=unclassified Thermodesulfovibrio TaxID=2645936 RepID=UPI000856DDBE|nr:MULTISPECIES: hypothetical protein [unclassified Thermodesulfovibrio]MDI1472346.1 hypothetical protein [Thermodesulfovibrio sp. 1176]MDI6714211.1 hypothetical protein [Thermodesulfovibrio sp.]ODA43767.1 hypothetical protein THER_1522 [Thermodesulfovibrio sp. N1]
MNYSFELILPVGRDFIYKLFTDLEKVFRLNPQWSVLFFERKIKNDPTSNFTLKVRYDISEREINYSGSIIDFNPQQIIIKLDGEISRIISLKMTEITDQKTHIAYEETCNEEISTSEKRNIHLWIKSIANYIQITQRKSIFSKIWLKIIDKIWLRLTPAGRRIVFFIVVAEIASLIFLIFILISWKIFK